MKTKLFISALLTLSAALKAQQINSVLKTGTKPQIKTEQQKNAAPDSDSSEMKSDKVFIFGVGSTDALNLDKLTAAGGLSVALKPSQRITTFLSFNYGGTVLKKEKSDSVQLSSLYFPDIASSAFTGSIEYVVAGFRSKKMDKTYKDKKYIEFLRSFSDTATNQLAINIEGSIQARNIEKDTLTYNLNIANINAGLKYRWTYQSITNNSAIFTIGACYNGVFINENSKKNFNALFIDDAAPAVSLQNFDGTIHGWSLLTSVQLNKVIVYFRTFDDFDRPDGLAFSVGLKATGTFFSF